MAANRSFRPYTKTIRPRCGDYVRQRTRYGMGWRTYWAYVRDVTGADLDGTVVVEYVFPHTARSSVPVCDLRVLRLAVK